MIKIMKIDKVETFNYEGDVYNLELKTNDPAPDHDDLYWIDAKTGLVTHNCFPKDLNAVMHIAESFGVDPKVLRSVWNKNTEVRPQSERDWENMKGRAVSE